MIKRHTNLRILYAVRTTSCDVEDVDVSTAEARLPPQLALTAVRLTVGAAGRPQHGRTRGTAALREPGRRFNVAVLAERQQTVHAAARRVACRYTAVKVS